MYGNGAGLLCWGQNGNNLGVYWLQLDSSTRFHVLLARSLTASEIWLASIIKSDIFIPPILGTASEHLFALMPGKPALLTDSRYPQHHLFGHFCHLWHGIKDEQENKKQLNNVKRSEINGPEERDPHGSVCDRHPLPVHYECLSTATKVAFVHSLGDVTQAWGSRLTMFGYQQKIAFYLKVTGLLSYMFISDGRQKALGHERASLMWRFPFHILWRKKEMINEAVDKWKLVFDTEFNI